jgi:Carboxypeptidase regulatory-like domain/WD40-like Beta Propeller Repeat/SPOR domain
MKTYFKLILPATLWALSVISADAQTILEQAQQAFKVRNYRQAIDLYEQGLSKQPPTIEAYNNLAQSYLVINQPDKAVIYFEKAIKNPEALSMLPLMPFYYGVSLNMTGEYQQAKTAFSKLPLQYKKEMEMLQSSCDFADNFKNKNSIYLVKNEAGLNSEKADFAPTFYKNKLIFSSSRTVELMGGYSDNTFNWLYIADRNGINLSSPKTISSADNLDKNSNISPVSYSKDGTKVAYMINKFTSGVRQLPIFNIREGELEIADGAGSPEWNKGTEQSFPHFKQDGIVVGFPCLSADGKTLYFSSNSNAGFGGFDIYVSFLENGRWSEPQNLGKNVNTTGDEISPYISEDGKLYFSSNLHKGFGGYDIYCSTYENKSWKSLRNLGFGVNSAADDMYFIFDDVNNLGYFTSNRENGRGDYDIYSAKLTGNENLLPFVLDKENADAMVNYPNGYFGNNNIVDNDKVSPNNNVGFNPNTNPNNNKPNPNTNPNNNKPNPNTNPNNNKPNPNTNPNNNKPNPNNSNPNEAPCATNFYIGALSEISNKNPITDATIYVKNLGTQQKEKATSNKFGEYSLILEPMSEYVLVVSKSGFENETFQIQTKSGGQKTLLGTRYLRRAGTSNTETDVFGDVVSNNNDLNNNDLNNNVFSPNSVVNTNPAKTDFTGKKYTLNNPNPNNSLPNEGYVIQVGLFSRLSESATDKLAQYGNISTEPRNGLTAYKVGTFADRQHAENTLAALKKEGYSEAWKKTVVIDNKSLAGKLSNSSQIIFPAEKPINVLMEENEKKPTVKENTYNSWADNNPQKETKTNWASDNQNDNPKNNKAVEFKVQLGAFKDAANVSFNQLTDLAPLEKQLNTTNGLTYFYLVGFENLPAAQQAKEKAAARGVQTPFVVGFKNGNRVALSEIIK